MGLTPSQENAATIRDRTLLVSAAAGSGKTYTLTQRIIKAIIEDGQDLSRLLIVTFTRAAAGELKAKISKALGEAIAEHPENIHLQKQLIRLGSAHISTIDSFFFEPVRENFEKLGLPASLRLSDESELAPIRDKILSETLDSFFDKCEPYSKAELSDVGYTTRYTELIGVISAARDSSNILPTFLYMYKKLMTSPSGLEQLKTHSERLIHNASIDFFDTLEGKALKDELESTVRYAWKTFIKCSDDMQSDSFIASTYGADFMENAELCHSLLSSIETGGYDEVKAAFDTYKPSKITSIKADMKTERSEYYKKLRGELNKKITDTAKKRLYLTQERLGELFLTYSEMCRVLYDVLSEFDKKYSEEKRRRGVCEFSDMPRFMLTLLLDENGNPTEYAKTLRESFDEVYIDEYQDVNEIQDTIFAIIGGSHRFMVGDIKQSIYGFREAEPSIFADYRRRFPVYNKANDTAPSADGGSTVFMSENFRCDENVISFTNAVCRNIFSAFSDSIGYTPDDDLKFGKKNPHEGYVSPKICLNLVQTTESYGEIDEDENENENCDTGSSESSKGLGDEAIVTANAIADLIRNEKKSDGSPITAGDIAVLVRSHVYSKPLIKALSALNIKYTLSSKGELFETEDMRLLTNLLSVIDNPRDDMPLCHLLTAESEVYTPEFTLEEVIRIRRFSDKSRSLYDAVIAFSESGDDGELADKCRIFVASLEKMRDAAGRTSADKLVKSLIFSERYASLTTTEAYAYLYDSVCRYVKNTWSSLYSFINYFKDVMERGDAGSEPDTNTSDSVRIMSIHQSKGLEFTVCCLFGFGKQFNMQNRFPLIFSKDLGPSMKLPPSLPEGDIESIKIRHEDNPIYKTVDNHNKFKQLEEEARIFYVALTRARERLVISATLKKSFDESLEKLKECADPVYEIKKSRSYINWILLTLSQNGIDESIYTVNLFDKGNVSLTSRFARASKAETHTSATPEQTSLACLLNTSKIMDTQTAILSNIPSKVAASKVSSHMLDDSIFVPIPTGKLFSESDEDIGELEGDTERKIRARIELMRSKKTDFDSLLEINKKPTAAERGTALHAFLQFCDFENVPENGIEQEIERLKKRRFISERTASIINRTQIRGLFESELYSFIRSSAKIRREFKFGMFRPASDFTENEELRNTVKDKKIYVQGSIDLLIEMPDGSVILCDYKTDRPSPEERSDPSAFAKRLQEAHSEQLGQYEYAVEKIFGKKPRKKFIYSLAIGKAIEV